MTKRIEIEQKFFCSDNIRLEKLIAANQFQLQSCQIEQDEYFTDIDSKFIKNRTCLRLRMTDNLNLELTFKGKSSDFKSFYAKKESNISVVSKEYDDLLLMLFSLGYYSYSLVKKKRKVYSKKSDNLIYNIMLDEIENIGSFVEFELLSNGDYDERYLLNELNIFVRKFDKLQLGEANLPYRDFVAERLFKDILPGGKLKVILLDLDGTLINSEQLFFKSFKKILEKDYQVAITLADYEDHELKKNANLITYLKNIGKLDSSADNAEIMEKVYRDYEQGFINLISSEEVLLNFNLLKKLRKKDVKLGLVTTCKKHFLKILFDELKLADVFDCVISREDVQQLKPAPDAYLKAMDFLQTSSENVIAIEDSERGISSALKSGIKTIQIHEYTQNKKPRNGVVFVDRVSRVLFTLINFLK